MTHGVGGFRRQMFAVYLCAVGVLHSDCHIPHRPQDCAITACNPSAIKGKIFGICFVQTGSPVQDFLPKYLCCLLHRTAGDISLARSVCPRIMGRNIRILAGDYLHVLFRNCGNLRGDVGKYSIGALSQLRSTDLYL